MLRNDRGLTLLEVLVTFVILSFIGIIIWTVFNNGIKYSNEAISKNQMQQEVNILLTNLTKIHQTSSKYTIQSNSNCTLTVEAEMNEENEVYQFENSKLCFLVTYNSTQGNVIDPLGVDNFLILDVTVSDKNDTANAVKIEAVLSRLKDY